MKIDGQTRIAGVTGWPVSHSRSPAIHNYWLRQHAINGVYLPFPVAPGHFETAIAGLQASGVAGVNVTMPHKEAAFALCHTHDAAAAATRAVNTLIFQDGDAIHGCNTDAPGFLAALHQAIPSWNRNPGEVIVLGAGGAARAIVWALLQAGIANIQIVNRSIDRAEVLAALFGGSVHIRAALGDLSACGLLVNTTSLGMAGQPPLEISLDTLPVEAIVSDIITMPVETPLLQAAAARGNPTVDGLGMLLHQAAAGFEAWFGVAPVVDAALRHHVMAG